MRTNGLPTLISTAPGHPSNFAFHAQPKLKSNAAEKAVHQRQFVSDWTAPIVGEVAEKRNYCRLAAGTEGARREHLKLRTTWMAKFVLYKQLGDSIQRRRGRTSAQQTQAPLLILLESG